MTGRKQVLLLAGFVLSVSLISSSLTALLVSRHYSRLSFHMLDSVCCQILNREPEAKPVLLAALKEYTSLGAAYGRAPARGACITGYPEGDTLSQVHPQDMHGCVLPAFGYRPSDFASLSPPQEAFFGVMGFLAGLSLFALTFFLRNKKEARRIRALTEYLEQAGADKADLMGVTGDDAFSKLEDEIYKTVTSLRHTKAAALEARDHYAENLSNIAHQLKTPITAISLSLQTLEENHGSRQAKQMQRQLLRLTRLEEALLVLSRLDAGALTFKKEEVDVFTLLVLASDNLQELSAQYQTAMDIPELGGMAVAADLDWTMEAVMNLMKNCIEHNKGGIVHCSYEQNPLYTQITIRDEGTGFATEDLPHLFERFYRGQNPEEGGIGIGLALAKEIVESQNGTLRAANVPGAGACFEIRFYSH